MRLSIIKMVIRKITKSKILRFCLCPFTQANIKREFQELVLVLFAVKGIMQKVCAESTTEKCTLSDTTAKKTIGTDAIRHQSDLTSKNEDYIPITETEGAKS